MLGKILGEKLPEVIAKSFKDSINTTVSDNEVEVEVVNDASLTLKAFRIGMSLGFRTFRQKTLRHKTFRQKHGGGRFGKKNMPKRLRLKTFAETFRMICGAYPVYARSPSPSQRPAPTTRSLRDLRSL